MLNVPARRLTAQIGVFVAALGLAACAPSSLDQEGASGWTVYKPLGQVSEDNARFVQNALFVANKRGNTLSKVDLDSGEEVLRLDSCANPHELAVSPSGGMIALACYGGTTVDIFEASDLSKIASVDLGENARPHGIVWHANGNIYVTAEGRQSVFVISDEAGKVVLAEHSTGKIGSHMLAVSGDGNTAWTTDLGSKTVTRIDLTRQNPPISKEVGLEPEGIAMLPQGGTLWVSARGSDKAFALDPDTLAIRAELETGAFPLRLAIRPQGDFAVTSDLADGALTVIDVGEGEALHQIAVSSREEAEARQQVTILWSDDGKRIYVAETGTDTIAEVDFEHRKVLRRIKVGAGGDGLAIVSKGFFAE